MSAALGTVAIATAEAVGDLDVDAPSVLAALADRGVQAEARIWDDPAVDWRSYDLVVVRSTWDYPRRRPAFLAWAAGLPRVLNDAAIMRWNTDKRYLADLAAAGVPTVPTTFAGPGDEAALPPWDEYVIKPTISVGSADTARWRRGSDDAAALDHLRGLLEAGRTAMLQPYLSAVDTTGESALLYLGGEYSHSALKGPLLTAGTPPIPLEIGPHYDAREQISARTATPAERAVAERALAAVPGGASALLYARVDLLPDVDGRPVVLELELTEPSLFLWTAPGSAQRLADAVVRAMVRARAG